PLPAPPRTGGSARPVPRDPPTRAGPGGGPGCGSTATPEAAARPRLRQFPPVPTGHAPAETGRATRRRAAPDVGGDPTGDRTGARRGGTTSPPSTSASSTSA